MPADPPLTPPGDPEVWRRLDAALHDHQRLLLTTHINPDGDGLGSEIALALYLVGLGKDVTILNGTVAPASFRFLQTPTVRPGVYDDSMYRERVLTSDAIVILDTAEWARLGALEQIVRQAHGELIVIDHHVCTHDIGDVFLSVPGASSTGELIYHLLRRRIDQLDVEISRALFVALATDTGWFRYNNTTADVLRIAAELIDNGVAPQDVYREVYENTTWADVELFRVLVNSMRTECDGRVAVIHLPKPAFDRYVGGDTDRILEYALSLPQIEVVLFFKQVATTATKLSLRSRGVLDVGELARRHGGGGHRNASGVLAQTTPDRLEVDVMEEVRAMLQSEGHPHGA